MLCYFAGGTYSILCDRPNLPTDTPANNSEYRRSRCNGGSSCQSFPSPSQLHLEALKQSGRPHEHAPIQQIAVFSNLKNTYLGTKRKLHRGARTDTSGPWFPRPGNLSAVRFSPKYLFFKLNKHRIRRKLVGGWGCLLGSVKISSGPYLHPSCMAPYLHPREIMLDVRLHFPELARGAFSSVEAMQQAHKVMGDRNELLDAL